MRWDVSRETAMLLMLVLNIIVMSIVAKILHHLFA
mgnify:FL=1